MNHYYIKESAWKRFQNKSFSNNEVEAISISIDIRKSTKMYNDLNAEETIKIIKPFIEECYIILNSRNIFHNFIYAGDGLIAVCYLNRNYKLFDEIFESAIDINSYIKDYKTWVKKYCNYGLNVGIGIAFDEYSYKEKIKNMPNKFNNTLLVGNSISKSTKLCANMPDKIENNYYNIAVSKSFYLNLNEKNKKYFKKKNKKKYYSDIIWK